MDGTPAYRLPDDDGLPGRRPDARRALADHEALPQLRFITCGSVDDGKSTLIGRLLHDTRQASDDQMAALACDSAKHGTQGEGLDFALLATDTGSVVRYR